MRALGAAHLSSRGVYSSLEPRGIFGTFTRARGGVLQFAVISAAASHGPISCGARTRKGTACKARPIPSKKRCKFHGGCSTGPKTIEGRTRIAEVQRSRWALWREERAQPEIRAETTVTEQGGGCFHKTCVGNERLC
ncbi:HGGxSTG domain-containing protein [Meridianimarinicoccus aquatilis]